MSLTIIDGFDNRSNNPLDAKYIVANVAALSSLQFKHKGVWRWVESEQNIYVLQNDLETWKPMATGSGIKRWVAGTYKELSLVLYSGALYESQINANASTPGANADWLKILGQKGDPGGPGTNGKSVYQTWLDNGNSGTVSDFLESIKGQDGESIDYYNPALLYASLKMVRYDGKIYESLVDGNDQEPGDEAYWRVLARDGVQIDDTDIFADKTWSSALIDSKIAVLEGIIADGVRTPLPLDPTGGINYPAATKGTAYKITGLAPGTNALIGGVSGKLVESNDLMIANVDTPGGDQTTAGDDWGIYQSNIDKSTETVFGTARRATSGEALSGTDDTAYMTSAKVKAYGDSVYVKPDQLPTGAEKGVPYFDSDGNLTSGSTFIFEHGGTTAVSKLRVISQYNEEDVLLNRGIISEQYDNTKHSAHITGRRSRGTLSSPLSLEPQDYIAGFTAEGYNGIEFKRLGYGAWVVNKKDGNLLSTRYEITTATDNQELPRIEFYEDVVSIGVGGRFTTVNANGTIRSTNAQAPETGAGLELRHFPGVGPLGYSSIVSIDRTPEETDRYRTLELNARNHIFKISGGVTSLEIDTSGNSNFGGYIKIVSQAEPATPSGGGILYVESGVLKYKGASGTVTTLGVA